jgi:serine protease
MCRALDADGSGWSADIAACVEHLVERSSALSMRVISMSLGGGSSKTMRAAVEHAEASGLLVVASAGNDGDSTARYPAAYPSVVSVAATNSMDRHASFSNANDDVELAAPGVGIVSTVPRFRSDGRVASDYQALDGTSMAAPHVAAVAAVAAHHRPDLDVYELRRALQQSADDLGPLGRDPEFGYGRINLARALGGGLAGRTRQPTPDEAPAAVVAPVVPPASTDVAVTPEGSGDQPPAPASTSPPAGDTPEPVVSEPVPERARAVVPRRQRRAAVRRWGLAVACQASLSCKARIHVRSRGDAARWRHVGAGRIRIQGRLAARLSRLVVEVAIADAAGPRIVRRSVRIVA